MKFTQIAQSLALIGTTAAATAEASYANTSFVPHGTGYFFDDQIYFNLILPNSGFSGFEISTSHDGDGSFFLEPSEVSGVYSPSGTPFQINVTQAPQINEVNNYILHASAAVQLDGQKSADVTFGGSIDASTENRTAEFIITLKGLPLPIEKRADQEFTITVIATSTSTIPSSSSTATTTTTTTATTTATETITTCFDGHCITLAPASTKTVISTTLVTITSCESNKCHITVVPTGVTCITLNSTTYTTFCPISTVVCEECVPISTTVTKTETQCITSNDVTLTKKVTFTTTECNFFTTVNPTVAPTTVAPTTAAPQTVTPSVAPTAKTTSAAPVIVSPTATFQGAGSRVTGSIFAVFAVLLSMIL